MFMRREISVVLQFLESQGYHATADKLKEESGEDVHADEPNVLEKALDLFYSETQPVPEPVVFPNPGSCATVEIACIQKICGTANPTCVAWNPSEKSDTVIVGSAGCDLLVIEIEGRVFAEAKTPSPVLSVAWAVSGWIACTCMGGEVVFFPNETCLQVLISDHTDTLMSLVVLFRLLEISFLHLEEMPDSLYLN